MVRKHYKQLQLENMVKRVIIGIILVSVLVFVASMLTPVPVGDSESVSVVQKKQGAQYLPWQIEPAPQGSIKVFGITLNETTLQEANDLYHGGAKVSLFVSPDGSHKVEAYFDKVVLGGFSAKLVMVMALSQSQQAAMFQRGARVSSLGGGRKRVTLATEDMNTVYASPIASLAYLTRARLDEELLRKRFGEPTQRIIETENNTTHWLYPDKGLDVALDDEGHAVLQYVSPTQFNDLMAPLLKLK